MSSPDFDDSCPGIEEREKTIEMSLKTRQKLAELMDQIDETVIALRAEIDHAKMRRGEFNDDPRRAIPRPSSEPRSGKFS